MMGWGFILQAYLTVSVPWQAESFLYSLKESPYSYAFLVEGMGSVRSVRFQKDATNLYKVFWNEIVFEENLKRVSGELKTLDELSSENFNTVVHESFHAFLRNKIASSKMNPIQKWMKVRSQNIYWDVPLSDRYRRAILEEAYAVFLGDLVSAHWKVLNILKNQAAACSGRVSLAKLYWDSIWRGAVYGYYRRDSTLDFYVDQFKGASVLFRQGWESFKQFQRRERDIFISQPITDLDRVWIVKNFLDSRYRASFKETFALELQESGCLSG